jgi:hypothetical protein
VKYVKIAACPASESILTRKEACAKKENGKRNDQANHREPWEMASSFSYLLRLLQWAVSCNITLVECYICYACFPFCALSDRRTFQRPEITWMHKFTGN